MRRNYFLIFAVFFFGTALTEAQYVDIHDFNGAAGSKPEGSLTLAGGKFYGMTYQGGANSEGCVFSMDTTGANYKDILDFSGANGKNPYYGMLVCSKGVLYGMTYQGGANNDGCIFSIDTNGNSYKDMHDFNGTEGKEPLGSLTLIGKTLFGMTSLGGANTDGCIFSIDTAGNNYKDIYDFSGAYANPTGDLTSSLSGKVLYGATSLGGANGDGNLFSIDTNGSNYKDLIDLNDQSSPDGANPPGALVLAGSRLYGMATNGGLIDFGIIFSIDTNGTGYKDMYEFGTVNGELPQGSLTLVDTVLYGMTTYGAGSNYGCMFSIDTNGSHYKVLLNFSSTNCFYPFGSLTLSGNTAYGTATQGGANSDGVIFSINNYKLAGVENLTASPGAVEIYPNPNNGIFTIQITNNEQRMMNVEVYNMLGEKVIVEPLCAAQGDNRMNMSNEPNGVYLYRIVSQNGNLIGKGKLVIQK